MYDAELPSTQGPAPKQHILTAGKYSSHSNLAITLNPTVVPLRLPIRSGSPVFSGLSCEDQPSDEAPPSQRCSSTQSPTTKLMVNLEAPVDAGCQASLPCGAGRMPFRQCREGSKMTSRRRYAESTATLPSCARRSAPPRRSHRVPGHYRTLMCSLCSTGPNSLLWPPSVSARSATH